MSRPPTELQSLSDEELVRQTRAGCAAAFEALVTRYEQRIYRFALNCCRNEADAREITQETFVRAFQAIDQFSLGHSFAAWLFTIARRKGIDRFRAAPPPAEEVSPELAGPGNPAELLAAREERQGLWQLARQVLSQNQFQALWLRYAEDMNVADVARALSKTETHVKVLLFRARLTLARKLDRRSAPSAQPFVSARARVTRATMQLM